jgi:hypothetical protein
MRVYDSSVSVAGGETEAGISRREPPPCLQVSWSPYIERFEKKDSRLLFLHLSTLQSTISHLLPYSIPPVSKMTPQSTSNDSDSSPPPRESPYNSPEPPADLLSYTRALYDHTLKQVSAAASLFRTQTLENGDKAQDAKKDDHQEDKHNE